MATPTLGGSMAVMSFKGIKVHVHWTFLLLVAWVAIGSITRGMGHAAMLLQLGYLLIVFVCVVLHEYGHALTALRYGVRTRDITLLPIGGVASLERMPEEPVQEFWITVAGPLVNLVIVVLAATLQWSLFGAIELQDPLATGADPWRGLLSFLLMANTALFLFNLVPAFPMDGGRILRSLLSMRMPRVQATRIAMMVGRLFAVVFAVVGLSMGHPMLALIALFIWFAAGAESRMVEQQAALRGIRVGQVMRTRFWAMPPHATVKQAVDELLAGGDQDLVVVDGGRYVGIITRRQLIEALSERREAETLATIGPQVVPPIQVGAPAHEAFTKAIVAHWPISPVMEGDRLVGVLEAENLAEYLMVTAARTRG